MAKVNVFRLTEELVFDRGVMRLNVRDPEPIARLDSSGAAVALLGCAGAAPIDRDDAPALWEDTDSALFASGLIDGDARDPVAILRGRGSVYAVTREDTPRKRSCSTVRVPNQERAQ